MLVSNMYGLPLSINNMALDRDALATSYGILIGDNAGFKDYNTLGTLKDLHREYQLTQQKGYMMVFHLVLMMSLDGDGSKYSF